MALKVIQEHKEAQERKVLLELPEIRDFKARPVLLGRKEHRDLKELKELKELLERRVIKDSKEHRVLRGLKDFKAKQPGKLRTTLTLPQQPTLIQEMVRCV